MGEIILRNKVPIQYDDSHSHSQKPKGFDGNAVAVSTTSVNHTGIPFDDLFGEFVGCLDFFFGLQIRSVLLFESFCCHSHKIHTTWSSKHSYGHTNRSYISG